MAWPRWSPKRGRTSPSITWRTSTRLRTWSGRFAASIGGPSPFRPTSRAATRSRPWCSYVTEELGPIDVLVNNAGVESIVPFLELDDAEWQRVTDVNLKGEWLCSQVVARRWVAQGRAGTIVNIGSVQAGLALPGRTHYAPTKRGIEALTRNMAAELAVHGIRVNCIHPGLFDTDMTRWVMADDAVRPIVLDKIALRRAAQPRELGPAVVFFASDDSSYVTGKCLYVDGGMELLYCCFLSIGQ